MAKVKDILNFFDTKAPFYMKLDFDNIGLLAGFPEQEVTRCVAALDITDEVIDEAIAAGAQLIVSHHPLLFHPVKSVVEGEDKGRKLIKLIKHDISAICMHTNLDTADGGVNDMLMAAMGAQVDGLLTPHGAHPDGRPYGVSRCGHLPQSVEFDVFLQSLKSALGCSTLRYVGGRPVRKVACCGGAGAGDMEAALAAGCDTYVTADLKYDHFLWAKEAGLNLIDADHFCTENVVVPVLVQWLHEGFPEVTVTISERHGQTIQFC
ncbi:MAG: Nif3-like dinuclear metal center hexameric protein [Oscillospiraceae bacterium]|nr:Nif3-like dinuclear metal center hexameric protein [Oscillospiraceae bacterium]